MRDRENTDEGLKVSLKAARSWSICLSLYGIGLDSSICSMEDGGAAAASEGRRGEEEGGGGWYDAVAQDRVDLLPSLSSISQLPPDLLQAAVSQSSVNILMHLHLQSFPNAVLFDLICYTNEFLETALHIAAAAGDTSILNALLNLIPQEHFVDVMKMRDRWGRTAVDVAKDLGHHHLLQDHLLSPHFASTALQTLDDPKDKKVTQLQGKLLSELQSTQRNNNKKSSKTLNVTVKGIFNSKVETISLADHHRDNNSTAISTDGLIDSSNLMPDNNSKNNNNHSPRLVALSKLLEYPGSLDHLQTLLQSHL